MYRRPQLCFKMKKLLYPPPYLAGDDAVEVARDVLDREDADAVLRDHAHLTIID